MKLLSLLISAILSIGLFVASASARSRPIHTRMTAKTTSSAALTRRSTVPHPSARVLKLQMRKTWKR